MEVGKAIRMARKDRGWTIEQMANMVGSDVGNISRLERGKQGASQALLDKIMTALGISLGSTIQGIPATGTNVQHLAGDMPLVPLLSAVTAGNWTVIMDGICAVDAQDWIACPVKHGARTFAMTVRGESMFNPHGDKSFKDGDIIYVDPDREPDNKSFVVVLISDSTEATFKQLIIDGSGKFLKPLNPQWPEPIIKIPEDATICGTVIFKGEYL